MIEGKKRRGKMANVALSPATVKVGKQIPSKGNKGPTGLC